MADYEILWVADANARRDYRDRQLYANNRKAICYIECHYNASAYDKPGTQDNPASCLVADNASKTSRGMAAYFAERVSESFKYPNRGCVVVGPAEAGYWNLKYTAMPAVLLEPLYVSDAEQALVAQSEQGQDKIAAVVADMVRKFFPGGGILAFSVGHKYKVSSPYDRGAPVVNSDLGEADLSELYLRKAARLLVEHDAGPPPAMECACKGAVAELAVQVAELNARMGDLAEALADRG